MIIRLFAEGDGHAGSEIDKHCVANAALGLSKEAHFSQVGHKLGQWMDVSCWQRLVTS